MKIQTPLAQGEPDDGHEAVKQFTGSIGQALTKGLIAGVEDAIRR